MIKDKAAAELIFDTMTLMFYEHKIKELKKDEIYEKYYKLQSKHNILPDVFFGQLMSGKMHADEIEQALGFLIIWSNCLYTLISGSDFGDIIYLERIPINEYTKIVMKKYYPELQKFVKDFIS